MELHDCHGIDCPLGIAHPPPNANPREGGVFPLGCGICRSEKMEILEKNKGVRQVVTAENMPKAYIYKRLNYIDRERDMYNGQEFDVNGQAIERRVRPAMPVRGGGMMR